jgi:aminotransferase class V
MERSTGSSSERLDRAGAPPASRVYLDYAGLSPVDPRVVAFMRPFLEGGAGNPAALHSHGLEARASLDGARAKVARLVGGGASGGHLDPPTDPVNCRVSVAITKPTRTNLTPEPSPRLLAAHEDASLFENCGVQEPDWILHREVTGGGDLFGAEGLTASRLSSIYSSI